MIKAIVAMAENRVIGNAGAIPWHLPEDFKFFKATTMGHTILMGRKTYESIGKPLPGRENIVLSRTMPDTPGVTMIRSIDELKEPTDGRDLFVIGGEEIYRLLLTKIQELYVTKVPRTIDGDTHFPEFESQFDAGTKVLDNADFSVWKYCRFSSVINDPYLVSRASRATGKGWELLDQVPPAKPDLGDELA
jgi:dihydrofolate reductase